MTRSPTLAMINHTMLKWAREKASLTIEDAAEKVEVTLKSLKSWEEGCTSPTFEELLIISEIYGLPVSMFYLSEWPDKPLLTRDKKAKEAFEYLKAAGFTADHYRAEMEREDDTF